MQIQEYTEDPNLLIVAGRGLMLKRDIPRDVISAAQECIRDHSRYYGHVTGSDYRWTVPLSENPAYNRYAYDSLCPNGDCLAISESGIELPLETKKQIKLFCKHGQFELSANQRRYRFLRESHERWLREHQEQAA